MTIGRCRRRWDRADDGPPCAEDKASYAGVVDLVAAIVGVVLLLVIVLAVTVQRRDRRAGREERDPGEMWRGQVREHKRDIRAMQRGEFTNPDFSWTHRPGDPPRE
jgi:hypothetical protein